MRTTPVTMATQHPDNAFPAPFTGRNFVSVHEEIEECFRSYSELGIQEYMWDWEGKFVDESVIDRLYQKYAEYFKEKQIGRDVFLTFRIPNIWVENTHRLPRALMNMVAAEHAAQNYGLHTPPLFEMILPMATSARQMIEMAEMSRKIIRASSEIFSLDSKMDQFDIIPLFEDLPTMYGSTQILEEYLEYLVSKNSKTEQMRVFIARSDPAMNAGMLPTMCAVKIALAQYHDFGKRHEIEMYPWIGGGSLPFRGNINPHNAQNTINEYRGAQSLTIQSAFRFDYPQDAVISAIEQFNTEMPKNRDTYIRFTPEEIQKLQKWTLEASSMYTASIEKLADFVNTIATALPNHRERVQHIGLFGYARGVGTVKLPRAIRFCGSFYSLGMPPEFISTGRALRLAREQGILPLLERTYVNLRADLEQAGRYVNFENITLLAKKIPEFETLLTDIREIESYLGHPVGPETSSDFLHRNASSNIYHLWSHGESYTDDILRAAQIRKSLG